MDFDDIDFSDDLQERLIFEPEKAESMRLRARHYWEHSLHSLELRIHGHEDLVKRLALVATQHLLQPASAQRLLLVGPPGCGKTTAALALAAAVRRPCVRISMEDITPTGWSGTNLGDMLCDLDRQALELEKQGHGSFEKMRTQPIVIIDELDKVCTLGHEGVSWSHQLQKQQSLLGLLAKNGQIIAGPDAKFGSIAARTLSTDSMLIICCGVFAGLPANEPPTVEGLTKAGLIPEIVERLGSLYRIQPLAPEHLVEVFKGALECASKHFGSHGYQLNPTAEALAFVARLVSSGVAGPRSGATWLQEAAEKGLIDLLVSDARPGTEFRLTPDDIRVNVQRKPQSKPRPKPLPPEDPESFSPSW